ncbi:MAG: GAF domain-containing protein [Comamonadaceae bacterium]|nr:MAG: GAF domain-containing protein [Comamonadaceae bacterium]
MQAVPAQPPVTLDNCDREPIHVPGHIQSHGALLGFDDHRRLQWASANAAALLDCDLPQLGEAAGAAHFGGQAEVLEAVADAFAAGSDGAPQQYEVVLNARTFDLIVHRSGDVAVAEFEPRDPAAQDPGAFAIKAHRGLDRLRRRRGDVQELLEAAVTEVRALTGFDRVMAYRFRHDASGDIVAEARSESLEPFLNRRYPASDIPAQARRLYVVNTLRLIADVRSTPVPLTGTTAQPLDLSHSVLRSVSPVHIEYLGNVGVGASMSVSIVINGQLWGMLACHHMAPRHVPYAVRMACDVLAQVLASSVQGLLMAAHGERMARAASLRSRIVGQMLHAEDALSALAQLAPELAGLLDAGAVLVADGVRQIHHGGLPAAAPGPLVEWLETQAGRAEGDLLAMHSLDGLPAPLAQALGSWCGILALRFDPVGPGWLVLLRREQVETIAWGGRPERNYLNGPLGPRLTPRGSFEVWRETVRGTAVPWSTGDLEIARQQLEELARASALRQAELSRARDQLLAVLGHDLRNPLQTISMTAHVLERGADGVKMGQRLQSASSRMQRLIAQVLDMSRLQSGLGLGFNIQPMDLVVVVNNIVEDLALAHPDSRFATDFPATLVVPSDGDRMAQLLGNLLSNARHHGEPGHPVAVSLRQEAGEVVLEVANHATPIAEDALAQLFTPFKRQSLNNPRNKAGLGLGLYIAREIARGHGGTLDYRFDAPQVVFSVRFPTQRPDA